MNYVIGIDGGGTKTEMIARTSNGRILVEKTLRGTNLYARPREEVEETLAALISDCIAGFGVPVAICMGAAGMIGEYSEKALSKALMRASGCGKILVCNDAKIALRANFSRGAGLSLTAGTGSVCVAQNEAGELFRAGGWGHLVSDEGSAYDVTRRALIAVVKANDGVVAPTALLREMCRRTGSRSFEELIDAVYRAYAEKSAFASLADAVTECARFGDEAASSVLRETADLLFSLCSAVIGRAGLEGKPFEVCYNGGVLVHDEIVRKRLSLLLKERFSCTIRKKAEKAVYGALALAQELSEKE